MLDWQQFDLSINEGRKNSEELSRPLLSSE